MVAPPPVLRGSRDFIEACAAGGLGDGLLAKGYPVAALLRGHQQGQDLLGLSSTDFKLLTEGPISPGRSSWLLMRGPRGGHRRPHVLRGLLLGECRLGEHLLSPAGSEIEGRLLLFSLKRVRRTPFSFSCVRELSDLI